MNTSALLDRWAAETPDAPAIIDRVGKSVSFSELRETVGRGASVLREHGVGVGDRVVLLVPISLPFYMVMLSVLRAGAVATIFDPSAGLRHISHCCAQAQPQCFIGVRKAHVLRLLSGAIRRIPLKFSLGEWVPGAKRLTSGHGSAAGSVIEPLDGDAPALLTFTSGSTGERKAAVRSHGLLAAQGAAVSAALELSPGEVSLTTLPVFTLANLAAGVTTLLADADLAHPGNIAPTPVLGQIEHYRPASVVASPAFLERLLQCEGAERASLRHLRRIYTGGAPVYPDLMRRLAKAVPLANIVAVYGSTEAEPVAHVSLAEVSSADEMRMRTGQGLLAGHPVPEIELRIIPNTFGTPLKPMDSAEYQGRCLAAGQAGEIVVTGAHVLRGYLGGVGDESTKFTVDGVVWHRTGDVGMLDDDGQLWLLGRANAVVRDAKGELFPFAVEVAAREVEGVRRAALAQHNGRRVLAVEGGGPDLERRVMEHLHWAKLDEVARLTQIPLDKRHNAKVDYPALAKLMDRWVAQL